MTVLGNLALWLALLVGVWGALAGFVGGRPGRPDLAHSARRAVFAMCGALLVAVFALEWALFQHDFNVEYVAAYTSRNLPIFYTWSALYAGQKGSLLFWATVLSVFGALALVLTPRRQLAGRDPQVDAAVLAVPLDRDLSGHVVGLRGAGVGRLLGLGSRRKRLAPPLAHDDRVSAFGDGPGKARHAQEMEPGADHRLVAVVDLRHVHHALGRDLERAFVHPVERGLLLPRVPGRGRRGQLHAVRDPSPVAHRGDPARVDGEP